MKKNNFIFYPYFENDMPADKPPVLFSLLNSYINFGKPESEKVSVYDLSEEARTIVFDFDYPLSEEIVKEDFEKHFIDHFFTRRIGTDTWLSWKIELRAKINEIMPYYNLLFDALVHDASMFTADGWTHTVAEMEATDIATTDSLDQSTLGNHSDQSTSSGNSTTTGSSSSTDDDRFSDTPQSQLTNVQNGTYLTDYRYKQISNSDSVQAYNTASGSDSGTTAETIDADRRISTDNDRSLNRTETRTGTVAKSAVMFKLLENARKIYPMIYKDCDELFYQLF